MIKGLVYSILLLSVISCSSFSTKQADSVFMVGSARGAGTSFLVQAPSGKSYLLTNAHVCAIAAEVVSHLRNASITIIEASFDTDLCLIEAPAFMEAPLSIADKEPQAHEKVFVIGFGASLGNTITEGRWVGRLRRPVFSVNSPAYITAQVLPGNSGSPVLNGRGQVVGVVFASSGTIMNRGLLVPLEDIKKFLELY